MDEKDIETKAPGRELAAFRFAIIDQNLAERTFTGKASVFNHNIRSWIPTIILNGAFKKTIKESFERIKLLWQHDSWEPVGIPLELKESQEALEVTGKVSETSRGKDTLILMRDGVMTDLSIGFNAIKWETERDDEGKISLRKIKEASLWEISFVTWGANDRAKIEAVHSLLHRVPVEFAHLMKPLADIQLSPEERNLLAGLDEPEDGNLKEIFTKENAGKVLSVIESLQAMVPEALLIGDPEQNGAAEEQSAGSKTVATEQTGADEGKETQASEPDGETEEKPDGEMEEHILSTPRTPTFSGTEETSWADVNRTFSALRDAYYAKTGTKRPNDVPKVWDKAPAAMKSWIAGHSLLGDAGADDFRNGYFFGCVNHSTGKLNKGGLLAIKGGRGQSANIPDDVKERATNKADALLKKHFEKKDEKNEVTVEREVTLPDGATIVNRVTLSGSDEGLPDSLAEKLKEVFSSFRDEELGGEPTQEEASLESQSEPSEDPTLSRQDQLRQAELAYAESSHAAE